MSTLTPNPPTSAHRARLVTEAVVSAYINEISPPRRATAARSPQPASVDNRTLVNMPSVVLAFGLPRAGEKDAATPFSGQSCGMADHGYLRPGLRPDRRARPAGNRGSGRRGRSADSVSLGI